MERRATSNDAADPSGGVCSTDMTTVEALGDLISYTIDKGVIEYKPTRWIATNIVSIIVEKSGITAQHVNLLKRFFLVDISAEDQQLRVEILWLISTLLELAKTEHDT